MRSALAMSSKGLASSTTKSASFIDQRGHHGLAGQIDVTRALGRLTLTSLADPHEAVALHDEHSILDRGAPVPDDESRTFEPDRTSASTLEARPHDQSDACALGQKGHAYSGQAAPHEHAQRRLFEVTHFNPPGSPLSWWRSRRVADLSRRDGNERITGLSTNSIGLDQVFRISLQRRTGSSVAVRVSREAATHTLTPEAPGRGRGDLRYDKIRRET